MDWMDIAREHGGWGVAGMLVAAFLLALDRGRIVFGREYERILKEMAKIAERAEAATASLQAALDRERSEYRERLERKQAELDRMRGGSP